MVQRVDQKNREQFDRELEEPLPGESVDSKPVSQETIDRENDNFDAVMGMIGG